MVVLFIATAAAVAGSGVSDVPAVGTVDETLREKERGAIPTDAGEMSATVSYLLVGIIGFTHTPYSCLTALLLLLHASLMLLCSIFLLILHLSFFNAPLQLMLYLPKQIPIPQPKCLFFLIQ